MKRLLLVAYHFPPIAGSGVFRPLRWVRALPRHGWQVSVLSASERVYALKDPSLMDELPAELPLRRARSLEPTPALIALNKLGLRGLSRWVGRQLALPDEQIGFVPFAARAAERWQREAPFDAVATTSAPYSTHLVGRRLKARCGIPWLADFRDEWTGNPYIRYPSRWHGRLNRRLEAAVLGEADRVLSVSEPWTANLRALAPHEPAEKFLVLENGWDRAHFPEGVAASPDRFRIVYTGMFYGPRSPRAFLEGAARWLGEPGAPWDEVEIRLMGHGGFGEGFTVPDVLEGLVHVEPQRPYREALTALGEAALLLLVVPPEGGAGNFTGKVYNYLASGRPILCQAPEPNAAASLIRESGSGVVVPPDDPAAVATALAQLYAAWKAGRGAGTGELPEQRRALIDVREADPQAARLAGILDGMLSGAVAPSPRS